MDKNITEEFQTSIKNGVVTGCLKFSNKFSSQIQIYSAVKEWEKEDKGLIYASIRTDGDDFIALDFRYDESVNSRKDKSILYDFLKPLFEEKLGEDFIQAWSISRESVIIK
ncbi:MAG: hypothetical protein RBT33_01045 [Candidatus Dojkabacteria bacterium]|jgi:hypothetical protein|nr:hypothetical protein [Candidatus Dojkabacteria bacterium]